MPGKQVAEILSGKWPFAGQREESKAIIRQNGVSPDEVIGDEGFSETPSQIDLTAASHLISETIFLQR